MKSTTPPVVELDSASHAAYVRFSNEKIKSTHVVDAEHCLVTIDTDEKSEVVGIELIGVVEFGVAALLKKAGVKGVSLDSMRNARYIPANAVVLSV